MHHIEECQGVPDREAKPTVYDGLYHEGWNQAYSESEGDDIYKWMLSFSR